MNAFHYLLQHLGWVTAGALVTSLLSLAFSVFQVRKKLKELKEIKEREDARVPAVSQELVQALADKTGTVQAETAQNKQKGSDEPNRDILAPSGQPNSPTVSIGRLKQKRMGAQ